MQELTEYLGSIDAEEKAVAVNEVERQESSDENALLLVSER
jgi:hypothetical protein